MQTLNIGSRVTVWWTFQGQRVITDGTVVDQREGEFVVRLRRGVKLSVETTQPGGRHKGWRNHDTYHWQAGKNVAVPVESTARAGLSPF